MNQESKKVRPKIRLVKKIENSEKNLEWLWTKLWPIGKYTSHWELTRQKLKDKISTKN